ncbi:hypothetical protein FRC17_003625 [Serendipita sp. 399]|nr:hypothetical protein FRC17_003625 [Serendipita sp. 399]
MQLQKGHDKYFGATALSEAHFDIHDVNDDFIPEEEDHAKFAIPASLMFSPGEFVLMAMGNLPAKEVALQIIEVYYGNATYAYDIIAKDDFMNRVFSPCYAGDIATVTSYKLASLYATLALGGLHDLSLPIYAPITREWMEVTQSLLMTSFGGWETSTEAIEAIALQCLIFPSRPEIELSKTYYQLSFALKMAQSIGLHRDPYELKMDAWACTQRRRLFLELRLLDATESIQYGRPLTMNGRYVSQGAILEDDLDEDTTFKRNMVIIMEEIIDFMISPGSSSNYSAVMKLDRKLRALKPNTSATGLESVSNLEQGLKFFMRTIWYHSALLTLHRPYFAFAATKSTSNSPSGAKFAPSVNASYEAASILVHAAIGFTTRYPGMISRMGPIWPHLSTSVVVLYSFGIHMPFWSNTVQALNSADTCLLLVFQPSSDCVRAKKTMPYLLGLQAKARNAFLTQSGGFPNPQSTAETLIPGVTTGMAIQSLDRGLESTQILRELMSEPPHEKGSRGMAKRLAAAQIFGPLGQQYLGQTAANMTSISLPSVPIVDTELSTFNFEDIPLPMPPILSGKESGGGEVVSWEWNPSDSSSYGSSPEQVAQSDLQASWEAFLSQL